MCIDLLGGVTLPFHWPRLAPVGLFLERVVGPLCVGCGATFLSISPLSLSGDSDDVCAAGIRAGLPRVGRNFNFWQALTYLVNFLLGLRR